MSKLKFAGIFGAGLLAGVLGTAAAQTALGRNGGTYGGELLILPMVLLILYAGYSLGRSRDDLQRLVQEAAGGDEPEESPESADYWRGYDEGYTDALDTMEYSRPPRRRPTKKRRRKDRQAVPERRQGA